jgi:SAM-dependent methyltransferase
MSTANEEVTFWDQKAETLESAIDSIAADPAAWDGEVLEKCLAQILPALDNAPHRKGHGPRVLDLGCGAGRLTIPIALRRPTFEMAGVDISQNMLDCALARDAAATVTGGSAQIRWIPCDGRSLPADLGRLDAAYSMIMLQHIPRKAQAAYISAVAAALVRGGVFRFQGLEGTEATFLHHYITEAWATSVCGDCDLDVVAVDRIRPFGADDSAPNALWVTAVKG